MRSTGSSDSDELLSEVHTYFRGVYPCGKRWKAQIHFEGSQHYLGTYESPEEAAQAYDEAARAHHGERGKTNYDRSGELTDAIKRRRARPRQPKRSPKPTPTSSPSMPMSVLGKRPLEYPGHSRHHSVPSVSSSHPTSPDMSSMDGYMGGDQYRAQIACLMDNRAYLESAMHQRPPSPQADQLLDEYVVCTIRLDDLMRRLRRVESQDSPTTTTTAAASTAAATSSTTTSVAAETRRESVAMDTRTSAMFSSMPPRFSLGSSSSIPVAVGGGGYSGYGGHGLL